MKVAGYRYVYEGLTQRTVGNHSELRSKFARYEGKTLFGVPVSGQELLLPRATAVERDVDRSSWTTAEDSDIILDGTTKQGGVFVKILVKPLVNLIWLAGFIFVVGCLITLWPDAREERRLAERYGESRALVRA